MKMTKLLKNIENLINFDKAIDVIMKFGYK